MRSVALLALLGTGCSFFLVKGPSQRVDALPQNAAKLDCTESTVVPLVDTIGGVLALSAAGVGTLIENTSDDGEPENFTKYYAGPLAVVAIVYLYAASRGNNKATWCTDANERLRSTTERVTPVGSDPDKPQQQADPEDPNQAP